MLLQPKQLLLLDLRNRAHKKHLVPDLEIRPLQESSYQISYYIWLKKYCILIWTQQTDIHILNKQLNDTIGILNIINIIYSLLQLGNAISTANHVSACWLNMQQLCRKYHIQCCVCNGEGPIQKCAKSQISKFCTINQMTYIEQFLSQHIITYYLSSLKGSISDQLFVNYHNQPNFFSLTWQILLFGENITKSNSRKWLISLINNNLRISYDDLKNVSLPKREDDCQTIQFIKTSFQYVYIQMHQIMVRIILAHLIIAQEDSITPLVQDIINQISYIYPALKAEISFNSNQINLTEWFQLYLSQLIKQKSLKPAFFQFLEMLKNQCHLIGALERLFDKFINNHQAQQQQKEYSQSVCEESRSQSMSKVSIDRCINDFQLLRKRKKIMKDRIKNGNSNSNGYITPQRIKEQFIPQTQKTDFFATQQNGQSSQSHASSSNFAKLLKKYKKPLVRTIYHGSTKTFVPKKSSTIDENNAQLYIQNLTASSSLTSNSSLGLFDISRKYSNKFVKISPDSQDKNQFCVPETPKQEPLKLSTQKKIVLSETVKKLPKLKI